VTGYGHGGWYDHAEEFWHSIDETQYLTPDETTQIYPVFLDFLADTANGIQPESSLAFEDLLDYFGWDYDTFDWDEFREWYDSI
jgi:hypothetical protein